MMDFDKIYFPSIAEQYRQEDAYESMLRDEEENEAFDDLMDEIEIIRNTYHSKHWRTYVNKLIEYAKSEATGWERIRNKKCSNVMALLIGLI